MTYHKEIVRTDRLFEGVRSAACQASAMLLWAANCRGMPAPVQQLRIADTQTLRADLEVADLGIATRRGPRAAEAHRSPQIWAPIVIVSIGLTCAPKAATCAGEQEVFDPLLVVLQTRAIRRTLTSLHNYASSPRSGKVLSMPRIGSSGDQKLAVAAEIADSVAPGGQGAGAGRAAVAVAVRRAQGPRSRGHWALTRNRWPGRWWAMAAPPPWWWRSA